MMPTQLKTVPLAMVVKYLCQAVPCMQAACTSRSTPHAARGESDTLCAARAASTWSLPALTTAEL